MVVLSEPAVEAQLSLRGAPPPGFPTRPGEVAELDGRVVLWLGPDEWLVLGGLEEDYPEASARVDVSANRVVFELVGDEASAVLAQLCALDVGSSVFPPGSCAQTLLTRVDVILVRLELGRWRILVRPSFADFVRAWLEDAIAGLVAG
jgi:sarcosine oxidase subunit gamma